MKMKHEDALKIFNLRSGVEFCEIRLAYRKACSKYHPDRNPAGLEAMKIINVAWQSLSDYDSRTAKVDTREYDARDYMEELNTALNAIITFGLDIEICGNWVWVGGETRPHKDTLKSNGFMWAPKKQLWYFRPADYKSKGRGKFSMDEIRTRHGSIGVQSRSYQRING